MNDAKEMRPYYFTQKCPMWSFKNPKNNNVEINKMIDIFLLGTRHLFKVHSSN